MKNTMDKMDINQKGKVHHVDENSKMQRRFLDIGISEGTDIECVLASYGGEMKAYTVKGAVIAIRKEDANSVEIEY